MLNGWVNYLFGENTGIDDKTGIQQAINNTTDANDDDWIMVHKETPKPQMQRARDASPVMVAEMKVESIDGSIADETEEMQMTETSKKHKLPRVGSCPNGLSQTVVAATGSVRNKKVRATNDRAHVAHVMFSAPSTTSAILPPLRAASPSLATRRIRRANATHNAGPARPMNRKTKMTLLNSGRSNDRKCQTQY